MNVYGNPNLPLLQETAAKLGRVHGLQGVELRTEQMGNSLFSFVPEEVTLWCSARGSSGEEWEGEDLRM